MSISRDPMAMEGAYLQAVGMVEAGADHREYGLDRLKELARMGHIKAGCRLADELVRDPPAKFSGAVADWALAAHRTGHTEALDLHLENLRRWGQAATAEEIGRRRRDVDQERRADESAEAARAAARKADRDRAAAPVVPKVSSGGGGFVGFLANPGSTFVLAGLFVLLYGLIWYRYMQ